MSGHQVGSANRADASSADAGRLRFAAGAGFIGFVLQFIASAEHPGMASPNDSAAVFKEYAASSIWTDVHLGQFAGALLIALTLLFIALSLPRRGSRARSRSSAGRPR